MEALVNLFENEDFRAVLALFWPIIIPLAFALYNYLIEQLKKRSPEYLQDTLIALGDFGYRVAEQRYRAGLIDKENRMDHAVQMAQRLAQRIHFQVEDDDIKNAIEFVISEVKEIQERELGAPDFDN